MKKSSVILVFVFYIVAFVIVAFLCVKVQVDSPTIYANAIVWDTTVFNDNKSINISYLDTPEKKQAAGVDVDAIFMFHPSSFGDGIKYNFKLHTDPVNATNNKIEYLFFDDQIENKLTYKILKDNTCDITFKDKVVTTMSAKTTDGKALIYNLMLFIY